MRILTPSPSTPLPLAGHRLGEGLPLAQARLEWAQRAHHYRTNVARPSPLNDRTADKFAEISSKLGKLIVKGRP